MAETDRYWDTLFLTITTDPEQIAYVRIMYDRDELVPGYNITRERRFDRDSIDLPEIVVRVVCSKGTYIRARARDIGEALDSGAHLTALRRTRVGNISVEQCEQVDELIHRLHNEEIEIPEELVNLTTNKGKNENNEAVSI